LVDNPTVLAPGKPKPPQPSVESATVDAAVELAILKQRVDDQEKLVREKKIAGYLTYKRRFPIHSELSELISSHRTIQ
jgi:hypothetical protein